MEKLNDANWTVEMEVVKGTNWTVEDYEKGYAVFQVYEGIEVIQQIDDFNIYNGDDYLAGKQAIKDGMNLIQVNHKDFKGWYVVNSNENVLKLFKYGYIKF